MVSLRTRQVHAGSKNQGEGGGRNIFVKTPNRGGKNEARNEQITERGNTQREVQINKKK
jgi:hypothetical protein